MDNPSGGASFSTVVPSVTREHFEKLPTNFEGLALELLSHVNVNGEAMYSPAVEAAIDTLRHWQGVI